MVERDRTAPRGFRWIYVTSFWHKRARRRLYATDYGKKAFRFLVRK